MTIAQDVIVTLAMLGAFSIVVRRLAGFARTTSASPKCASCESGGCAPTPAASSASRPPADQAGRHPLVFIRSSR